MAAVIELHTGDRIPSAPAVLSYAFERVVRARRADQPPPCTYLIRRIAADRGRLSSLAVAQIPAVPADRGARAFDVAPTACPGPRRASRVTAGHHRPLCP